MEEDDLDPDQLDVGILHLKWSLITKIFEKLVVKFTLIYFILYIGKIWTIKDCTKVLEKSILKNQNIYLSLILFINLTFYIDLIWYQYFF